MTRDQAIGVLIAMQAKEVDDTSGVLNSRHAALDLALAALRPAAPAPQETTWRDIETHDGSYDPVLVSDGKWSCEAYWDRDRREWYPVNVYSTDAHGSSLDGLTVFRAMPPPPKGSTP